MKRERCARLSWLPIHVRECHGPHDVVEVCVLLRQDDCVSLSQRTYQVHVTDLQALRIHVGKQGPFGHLSLSCGQH